MRITKEIKQEIKKQLARNVYQKPFDALCKKVTNRLDSIAKSYFSKNNERAIALGVENEDLLRSVNSRFQTEKRDIRIKGFELLKCDFLDKDRYGRARSSQLQFYISSSDTHKYELPIKKTDEKFFDDAMADFESLEKSYIQFLIDVESVLCSINTKNQLIQVLPEAERYLPEEPKRLPLPTQKAELIRAKLKKAA